MSLDRPHSGSCPMGYSESIKDDMVLSDSDIYISTSQDT